MSFADQGRRLVRRVLPIPNFARHLDRLFVISGVLAAVFLVGICVLVTLQIVGRLVGIVIPSADEFAGYCLAASSFLALAYTLRSNSHIRVVLLLSRLPTRLRFGFEVASVMVALAVSAFLTYFTLQMIWFSFIFGDMTQGLVSMPLWIPQSVMGLGTAMLTLALLVEAATVALGRDPTHLVVEKETAKTQADLRKQLS